MPHYCLAFSLKHTQMMAVFTYFQTLLTDGKYLRKNLNFFLLTKKNIQVVDKKNTFLKSMEFP